ncbi:MAG TPA: hypothetical protein VEC06_21225 [Paucimonas sp.]|nr:hypothetical protein [Paucimonas sp.]
MELMHSHRWVRREPDWTAAAVSGFVAGAVLMVLELLWSVTVAGEKPWATTHMIAALLMGTDALHSMDFSLGVAIMALVTHYVLGIFFAVILAMIMAPFHLDSSAGMALAAGAVFGLLLYWFNFYGMVRFFTWFEELRGWPSIVAHLVFGMTAALAYWKLERREKTQ